MSTTVRPTAMEAGPLLHALCARAAEDVGVRALAIKGPVVALQGLRAPRASADIDVLVHPDDLQRYAERLRKAGWYDPPQVSTPRLIPSHSVDLLHEHWPCGIDLHHYYPGFLAPDGEVFEELWTRRASYELAGVEVPALDPVAQTALVALHLLRDDPHGQGGGFQDLTRRASDVLGSSDRDDLLELARTTDALVPLLPLLTSLGLEPASPLEARYPERLGLWRERAGSRLGDNWAAYFRRLPWWQWPVGAWRALMLPEEELRAYHSDRQTEISTRRLRLRRLRRAMQRVPDVLLRLISQRRQPDRK